MQFRRFLRFLFPRLQLAIVPDEGGGSETPAVDGGTPSDQPPAGEVDTGGQQQAVDTSKPASMLDAMFGAKPAAQAQPGETQEQAAQRLRDEKGRFAPNPPADPNAKPAAAAPIKPAAQPQQPTAQQPAKPAEKAEHQMPEGLKPEAQQRFQNLVSTNKELTARVQEWQPIVDSALQLQQTFQTNGVRREQFDQAMQVVGLMNRGDLEGALKVIDEQRALISMALGRPLPGADPLAKFPDLRQAVDNLQITEAHAIELARGRTQQHAQQQVQQRQQVEQHQNQQSQQAVQQGQVAVDTFCKRMMQTDMDYASIEPVLLQQIQGGLLNGVPPTHWAALIEKTYGLIKQTAGTVRSQVQTTTVLRPTGGEPPRQAPQNMHQAMWGAKA